MKRASSLIRLVAAAALTAAAVATPFALKGATNEDVVAGGLLPARHVFRQRFVALTFDVTGLSGCYHFYHSTINVTIAEFDA